MEDAERPDRFGAFVSYRHTDPDRRWARWLHTALETYRVPRRLVAAGAPARIGRVFRDEEELSASADLSQRIDEALARAGFLVVVCSPRTPASRWVEEEVRRFQAMGRGDRVLALLIEGEPEQSFPSALRGAEPLAADVRPTPGASRRGARRTALLKLLAALLEVPYDDLRHRDEERARRRLAWLAGGATALAVILLWLSLFAWGQWQRAERELRLSRAQKLAVQAQVAYVTVPQLGDAEAAPDLSAKERGVLLALESLRATPTVAGDQALRAGLRQLGLASLEVAIGEGEELAGLGPHGGQLLLRTEQGPRFFDVSTRTYHSAEPGSPETQAPPRPAEGGILAVSRDRKLQLVSTEEGTGGWVAANAVLRRASDGETLAVLPHEWFLRFAAFSADGRWLVTVTQQVARDAEDPSATALVGSTVRVWEVPSGRKDHRGLSRLGRGNRPARAEPGRRMARHSARGAEAKRRPPLASLARRGPSRSLQAADPQSVTLRMAHLRAGPTAAQHLPGSSDPERMSLAVCSWNSFGWLAHLVYRCSKGAGMSPGRERGRFRMSSRSMLALRVSCAAVLVYLAMAQAPAFAAGYRCYGLYTTPTVTGTGSDCSAAQADLTAQLNAGAATNCLNAPYSAEGPCNKSTTITAACSCDENGCSVSGYMQHGCWNCGMPGGPICP